MSDRSPPDRPPTDRALRTAPGDRRARAVAAVRKGLIERKMTQAELADAADCHEKTIQNLIAGKSVRDQTLFDVCMVLGLDFEDVRDDWHGSVAQHDASQSSAASSPNGHGAGSGGAGDRHPWERLPTGGLIAPVYMGAYSRAAVDHYIGSYLTLRADFTHAGRIVAYRTDIAWDPDWPSLLFAESGRPDQSYAHRGRLYVPASSMFIHLVSLTKGAMRMIVVSQIDRDGVMRGLITTLNKQRATFVPVATPIVYVKRDDIAADTLGDIADGHACFKGYSAMLAETTAEGYARLVAP